MALGANFGGEVGAATRSHQTWGPIVGAHLELNPIAGLHIGGYITDTIVEPDEGRSTRNTVSFVSVGGRLRYLLPVIPKLRVIFSAGVGYVYAEYPGYPAAPTGITNPTVSQQLGLTDVRDGNFIEVPLGLGAAYTVFSHTDLSLTGTWRPGYSFKGAAYEGDNSYAKPTQGVSITLGLSFFF